MNKLTIFIPSLPPTTNMAYRIGRGHLYKTEEGKSWQQQAALIIGAKHNKNPHEWKGKFLACELYFMNKSVLLSDIDGRVKPILDCISQKMHFDDRYVLRMELYQIKGPTGVLIKLRELTEEEVEEVENKWRDLLTQS